LQPLLVAVLALALLLLNRRCCHLLMPPWLQTLPCLNLNPGHWCCCRAAAAAAAAAAKKALYSMLFTA
jgi:hypothetical protein